ncbi:hypothetical protein NDU88_010349 [Pleurodeles waltl]|uniref:Uncharacterized protein n=1 Tax=Pleurodeles waltl TaxID=8319 RepID=A0AAV7QX86_PLEWA|nr:hypothetical protein NDU88_010349 [Pleurodeles waltl]
MVHLRNAVNPLWGGRALQYPSSRAAGEPHTPFPAFGGALKKRREPAAGGPSTKVSICPSGGRAAYCHFPHLGCALKERCEPTVCSAHRACLGKEPPKSGPDSARPWMYEAQLGPLSWFVDMDAGTCMVRLFV